MTSRSIRRRRGDVQSRRSICRNRRIARLWQTSDGIDAPVATRLRTRDSSADLAASKASAPPTGTFLITPIARTSGSAGGNRRHRYLPINDLREEFEPARLIHFVTERRCPSERPSPPASVTHPIALQRECNRRRRRTAASGELRRQSQVARSLSATPGSARRAGSTQARSVTSFRPCT